MWILIIIGVIIVVLIIALCNGQQKRSDVVKPINEYDYYKQKKAYENKIYEENNRNEKSYVDSYTQDLTDTEVSLYLPYMDSNLASQYRKALLNGQYNFNVRKELIEQWNRNRVLKNTGSMKAISSEVSQSKNIDSVFNDINREYKELQNKNRAWEISFTSAMGSRKLALNLEKEDRLMEAIKVYEQYVYNGIKSKDLNIYNYAHDIERLFILYRKTKQKDKEIIFLSDMIKKHLNYRDVSKWQERLNKLTNK